MNKQTTKKIEKIFSILIEEVHDHTTLQSCRVLVCRKYVDELFGEYPFIIMQPFDHINKGEKHE